MSARPSKTKDKIETKPATADGVKKLFEKCKSKSSTTLEDAEQTEVEPKVEVEVIIHEEEQEVDKCQTGEEAGPSGTPDKLQTPESDGGTPDKLQTQESDDGEEPESAQEAASPKQQEQNEEIPATTAPSPTQSTASVNEAPGARLVSLYAHKLEVVNTALER